MDRESIQAISRGIASGSVGDVRKVLDDHPELVKFYFIGGGTWLHQAAGYDNVAMVEMLVEKGIDVNSPRENDPDGPLYVAAGRGFVEVVRWLLDHGAEVSVGGGTYGTPLISAAGSGSLETVRLLLERGADPNVSYDKPPKSALTHALMFNHGEIAELLRAHGAAEPASGQTTQPGDDDAIVSHFRKHFGKVSDLALREIVPGSLPIAIHVIPAVGTRNRTILFTSGMSASAMTVPAGQDQYRYAELVMHLPPDWPVSLTKLASAQYSWPIDWLRGIARYPHENDTWLGGPFAVIANGEPPEPLGPGTDMTCVLLLAEEAKWGRLKIKGGKALRFYNLFPLYTEERDLERTDGIAALLGRFEQRGVSEVVDPARVNVGRM